MLTTFEVNEKLKNMTSRERVAFAKMFRGSGNAGKTLFNFVDSKSVSVSNRIDFNCRNCGSNDIQNNKCQHCQTKY